MKLTEAAFARLVAKELPRDVLALVARKHRAAFAVESAGLVVDPSRLSFGCNDAGAQAGDVLVVAQRGREGVVRMARWWRPGVGWRGRWAMDGGKPDYTDPGQLVNRSTVYTVSAHRLVPCRKPCDGDFYGCCPRGHCSGRLVLVAALAWQIQKGRGDELRAQIDAVVRGLRRQLARDRREGLADLRAALQPVQPASQPAMQPAMQPAS